MHGMPLPANGACRMDGPGPAVRQILIRKLVKPRSAGLCRLSRKARVRRNGGPHFKNAQRRGWPGRGPPAGSAREAQLRRCIRLTWGPPCLRECALQLDFSGTLNEALLAFGSVNHCRVFSVLRPLPAPWRGSLTVFAPFASLRLCEAHPWAAPFGPALRAVPIRSRRIGARSADHTAPMAAPTNTQATRVPRYSASVSGETRSP